jgi:hypothetical protein
MGNMRQLTLILLMWRIWWAPNNSSKWRKGFNSAFKGLRDKGGNRAKWSKTVKHWKRGWNEEMKMEAESYETDAGRGSALILLALKRAVVLELCVLMRASSLGNEWLVFMTYHSCSCAAANHQASSQDQAPFPPKMNGGDGLITRSYRSFYSLPDGMEETSQEYRTLAL